MSRTVYVNGSYLPEEQATVSIFDRGFVFADGIYEVSSVVEGRLVDVEAHLIRLERSCGEIQLPLPWSRAELVAIHKELIARNNLKEGGVYLQVTRGPADRDFAFPKEPKPTLVMFTQARKILDSEKARTGVKIVSCEDIRWARRDIKSVALLAQVLAKQHAAANGADEAWMTEDGYVTEGGSSTSWIVKGDTIISRPLSNDVLPGITRKALLGLLAETDYTFEERAFTLDEAFAADEAFYTSASGFVMPIVEIDGRRIGGGQPGPAARRLREIYIAEALKGGVLG
ncbi:MAG: D-amino-acid transaminase [Bosea sp. (in: a-proteobacteria)]